ncbi:phosphatase PAP2 family protein [Steroidobacter sp. S1-65]|uniref:Phosphatase PAP2 family protein n=2 Tax=Steroidobacter gossypii TaxID=2805490 RepID=A0ABS1WTA7_9GAMM|nr:phosphatase PAP2 family protein [Steroidobacter gossypii]
MPSRCAIVWCVLMLSGCGTLPDGKGWGEEATPLPGWERVQTSAINAAKDPWTWGPLLGAAAFQIDDFDRRASDWAREHTPVFGSERSARQWSDDLRSASSYAHYVTIAATPSGNAPGEWLLNKLKGTLVGVAAVSATGQITNHMKEASDRERPNGADGESFPSGHTSSSAVHTRLASRNLQSIEMSDGTRAALDVGLHALTIGTSWARIEAGWHYPADTLFSMALGNFMAAFINDAFMGLSAPNASLALQPVDGGAVVQMNLRF